MPRISATGSWCQCSTCVIVRTHRGVFEHYVLSFRRFHGFHRVGGVVCQILKISLVIPMQFLQFLTKLRFSPVPADPDCSDPSVTSEDAALLSMSWSMRCSDFCRCWSARRRVISFAGQAEAFESDVGVGVAGDLVGDLRERVGARRVGVSLVRPYRMHVAHRVGYRVRAFAQCHGDAHDPFEFRPKATFCLSAMRVRRGSADAMASALVGLSNVMPR